MRPSTGAKESNAPKPSSGAARVSSSMDAVVRLMSGKEGRTIADKIADTSRPRQAFV